VWTKSFFRTSNSSDNLGSTYVQTVSGMSAVEVDDYLFLKLIKNPDPVI
jgi:hypothetical protein